MIERKLRIIPLMWFFNIQSTPLRFVNFVNPVGFEPDLRISNSRCLVVDACKSYEICEDDDRVFTGSVLLVGLDQFSAADVEK